MNQEMNQVMKMNHQWTRIDTNRAEDGWTCFNGTRRPKGIPPGARASRPHQAWHSLGHLLHLDQPGTAPGDRYFFMNMDAQDAQDKQDEGLLRGS